MLLTSKVVLFLRLRMLTTLQDERLFWVNTAGPEPDSEFWPLTTLCPWPLTGLCPLAHEFCRPKFTEFFLLTWLDANELCLLSWQRNELCLLGSWLQEGGLSTRWLFSCSPLHSLHTYTHTHTWLSTLKQRVQLYTAAITWSLYRNWKPNASNNCWITTSTRLAIYLTQWLCALVTQPHHHTRHMLVSHFVKCDCSHWSACRGRPIHCS